jgi:hypothetical protein
MYNVGFGDCFLLEFPRAGEKPFRVLVDCGAHRAGYPRPGWKPEETVDRVVADITEDGGDPVLDVVVATHRHEDHVSGFRAAAWSRVTVGEVWMPWTEHPTDPLAAEIRNRQSRLALGLQRAFDGPGFAMRWSDQDRATALRELAANSLTNAEAMSTLHRGFRGRPRRRFLPETERSIVSDRCPGLTVHVLGPSRDPEVIRDMDPPAGQSYLRFIDQVPATDLRPGRAHVPFAPSFTFDAPRYEADGAVWLDPAVKEAARAMMRDDDFSVAVSLDKAVNGTSLMLMFEMGEAYLLFPGDAQWGTWDAVLADSQTRDLVARTTFYKVGHHGSHNATPTEFVEGAIEKRLWGAAASVREIRFWPEIPRGPLLDALEARADRVVRSDRPGRSRAGVGVRRGGTGVDFKIPW